jgi:hypothetical protein
LFIFHIIWETKCNTRILVLCNHPICDYVQLFVTCNYVLSFLQLIAIISNLLLFLFHYGATIKLYILPYWLTYYIFPSKICLLCSFSHKINYNLVISYYVLMHLMYLKILWTTLKIYLASIHGVLKYLVCIQGILGIYLFILPIWDELKQYYYKMWVQFISPRSLDQWIHSKYNKITWRMWTPFVVMKV